MWASARWCWKRMRRRCAAAGFKTFKKKFKKTVKKKKEIEVKFKTKIEA